MSAILSRLTDINSWMSKTILSINDSKTDIILNTPLNIPKDIDHFISGLECRPPSGWNCSDPNELLYEKRHL